MTVAKLDGPVTPIANPPVRIEEQIMRLSELWVIVADRIYEVEAAEAEEETQSLAILRGGCLLSCTQMPSKAFRRDRSHVRGIQAGR